MRVLVLGHADPWGLAAWRCRDLRAHNIADVRLAVLHPGLAEAEGGPRSDLATLHDGGQELRTLLGQAEIIHLIDVLPSEVPLRELVRARRWIVELTGARPAIRDDALAQRGPGVTLITQQPIDGARLVPPAIPLGMMPFAPLQAGARARVRGEPTVLFASAATPLHEYPGLEALVDRSEQIAAACHLPCRVDVLTGKPPRLALQRQRRAHVALTDRGGELPIEALIGLAQGLVSVAQLDAEVRRAYEALAGQVPVLPPELLPAVLERLDPAAEPDPAASAWVEHVCGPDRWRRVARELYRRPTRSSSTSNLAQASSSRV